MTKILPEEQINTLHLVLNSGLVTDWSSAIDGGANCGDWSIVMSRYFDIVHSFEPSGDTYSFLVNQTKNYKNIVTYKLALMDRQINMTATNPPKKPNNRSTYMVKNKSGEVRAIPIDLLNIQKCGLLKLDIEGAEYHALLGARDTIERCRPVIIVEIGRHGRRFGVGDDQTTKLIESMGYVLAHEQAPDRIYTPITQR